MIHLHHNYLSEKRIKINMKQTIVGTKEYEVRNSNKHKGN